MLDFVQRIDGVSKVAVVAVSVNSVDWYKSSDCFALSIIPFSVHDFPILAKALAF